MLADHLPTKSTTGKPCSVGVAMKHMTDEDRTTLARWFADGIADSRVHVGILGMLGEYGVDLAVSQQQIGHHRRRTCTCKALA